MELNIDKMAHDIADKVFDEVEYNGKTLRRWVEAISKAQWISVEDRLPDFNISVLVYAVGKIDGYFGDSKTAITEYSNRQYGFNIVGWNEPWQYFLTDYKITHWMPLPESPKEE